MTKGQYLYGPPRPVMAKFDTANGSSTYTFSPGDLVVLDSAGNVLPMGTSTVTVNFLGVSAQNKPAGTSGTALRLLGNNQPGLIRIDTDGVWMFPRSDTVALNVGDPVTTDGVTANTLKKAGHESISIGRVAEPVGSNANGENPFVKVKIQSAVFPAAKTT